MAQIICGVTCKNKYLQKMEVILDELERQGNWKEFMRFSCRRNGLSPSLAADLTILKLRQLEERFKKSSLQKTPTSWMENELKAYNWLLIALSALSQILIKDFSEEQWATLKKVFVHKNPVFLRFEARKLIEGKSSKNRWWSEEEDQMLVRETGKYKSNDLINWNDIAHRMFEYSEGKIFRSGKHCREHWLNHLDPNKQRGAWSVEDDLYLMDRVAEVGKKWSQHANALKRTEHMVKNRFNSLIMKQKKLTPHIKKEQKLIKQVRTKLEDKRTIMEKAKEENQDIVRQESEPSLSQEENNAKVDKPSIEEIIQSEVNNNKQKKQVEQLLVSEFPLKQQMKEEVGEEGEAGEKEEAGERIEVQNPLSNYSPMMIPNCDLNFFIKEDSQMKKTIFSQFARYSPYSSYSPYSPYIVSPSTPNNYIPSAPIFVSNQFYNYYNHFMSMTDLSNPESKDNRDNSTK